MSLAEALSAPPTSDTMLEMAGLGIHLFIYIAGCSLLTGIWFFTEGSLDAVRQLIEDPTRASALNFWPIWIWMSWSALVVIHVGTVLSMGLLGRRRRATRRAEARRRREEVTRTVEDAARKGMDVAKQAVDTVRAARGSRAPTGPERRWVTVMFADIANSTALAEAMGDEEWHGVIARYRDLVRRSALARAGSEVGTQGDGLLVRFPTPAEAVLCAVDVQQQLHDAPDVGVRIGIHAGEAVEDEGDLIGRVINLASRVMSEAKPGEILVTEPVADYVGSHLTLEDRGLRELRGLSQPRHLLAVVWS